MLSSYLVLLQHYKVPLFLEGVTAIIKNVKNRNFPIAWVSGKFTKYGDLSVVNFEDFGNFSNDWKFPRYPGILGIPQIPRHLRHFPNT